VPPYSAGDAEEAPVRRTLHETLRGERTRPRHGDVDRFTRSGGIRSWKPT